MGWICIGLAVLCVAFCVVALRYRNEYLRMHIVYQDHLNLYYDLQDKYQSVCDENRRFSNSISSLNSALTSEIDLKTLAEQRYEDERKLRMDAELRVRELEKKLPKRDSKGRFCKK